MEFYVKDKQIKLGGTHIPIGSIVYSFITNETISIIHEKINYNGLIVNLKKENGSNYADKAELEAVLPDFFKGGTDSGIVFQEVSAPPELVNIPENTLVVDTTNNKVYLQIGAKYYTYDIAEYTGPAITYEIIGDNVGGKIPVGQLSVLVNFTINPLVDVGSIVFAEVKDDGPPTGVKINGHNIQIDGSITIDFDTSSASTGNFFIELIIDGTPTNDYSMTINP